MSSRHATSESSLPGGMAYALHLLGMEPECSGRMDAQEQPERSDGPTIFAGVAKKVDATLKRCSSGQLKKLRK